MLGLLAVWLLLSNPAQAAPLETELPAIVDLFYDLQFDSATAAAQRLEAEHPGHPAGPFYKSIVFYQRFLSQDNKSTETLKAFEAENARAVAAAELLIATAPAQGHYYLGGALGFHARVLASQKRYFKAVPEGMRGIRHLKKALALDPSLEDAYMGIGMYHYFRARMPAAIKPFAFLITGETGNRELGLEELHRAADKGGPARMEARSVLSTIYLSDYEKRWDKSEAFLKDLMERYPHNPIYRMRRVYVAEQRGDWAGALALADPNGPWIKALDPSLQPTVRTAELYRAAECLILSGRADEAEPLLRELESLSVPETLKDWILLREANALDAAGKVTESGDLYRKIEQKDAARVAREFLKTGWANGPKTLKPWTGVETPS